MMVNGSIGLTLLIVFTFMTLDMAHVNNFNEHKKPSQAIICY